jgi:deoxyribodipyrimidine photo-lyase
MQYDTSLFWFRRDLRVDDNAALYRALKTGGRVYCVFVFDTAILGALPSKRDRRVEFIRESVAELKAELENIGGGLAVLHGNPEELIPQLAAKLGADAVFANHDYEPQAVARDAAVAATLQTRGVAFHGFKDQVIFERDEVLTGSGKFFSVFTPYKNAWLRKLDTFFLQGYPVRKHAHALKPPTESADVPSLESLGFEPTNLHFLNIIPGARGASALFEDFKARMAAYAEARDYPAVKGPSYLSVHLRFGTISIRAMAREAWRAWQGNADFPGGRGAEIWLSELVWRDFYFHILHHNPHVVDHAFRPEYDALRWESGPHADELFAAWCEARTGYPLVDAAMRQLNQTGYMHNRLRMVVASFLTKDLGIDWRRGECYFAQHLNDFDLAANNGGWQWAASTGCDAQPYFRIFNPVTQSERFDPHGKFIRRYLPQLAGLPDRSIHAPWLAKPLELAAAGVRVGDTYPHPIVDHALARQKTLDRFKAARPG